jgi:hypothetical protein
LRQISKKRKREGVVWYGMEAEPRFLTRTCQKLINELESTQMKLFRSSSQLYSYHTLDIQELFSIIQLSYAG